MNRKLIIIVVIVAIVLAIAASVAIYLLSFRSVTFNFKKDNLSISVYRADDTDRKSKVAETKQTTTVRLQEGKYVAIPSGDNYSPAPISFSVDKSDSTVTISPAYSSEHLNALLSEELPAINSVLQTSFGTTLTDFEIARGKLYLEGQWYATTFTHKMEDPADQGDIYRTILLKKDNQWTIVGKPKLVATQSDFPSVPLVVLQDVNRLGE